MDKSWTLFLDRDGVINLEKKADYILHVGEFGFYEGVLEAMPVFNQLFGTIVMVTNQKGIGKGLMTVDHLTEIHDHMLGEMKKLGGRIDKIYFAPDLDQDAYNRKPNPGMAFQAKADFPDIDFTKSIMVGNKLSDMEFAHNAGIAHSVFLATTNPETPFPHPLIEQRFNSLAEYAAHLQALTKA
ncbi:D-glycero-D-manno-heptose 1,7-bisphosphate phosphatase/D-glycero-alpha-D-manno-heptose 1-phosphate guanylyltransferase [Filimonas lacunae]|uniref:D,D-heptose 1,7-bisphosphate phosphatase n=2 Tax=Filimonas lacunae TaxID=477680 RepID=A0A173MF79_9BACT|nr:D-glycero-D-manno-heptose 1,7-bisphosphate phosphatase [Filimonas lacunae]SIT25532.1 D-glycero-D-manno-heptose 1,7-bisphosphate phosphatase/D-glycero-alpha-D-manno-heptose 1-phosphate guanylyltransferase [Filimonas lacunae]